MGGLWQYLWSESSDEADSIELDVVNDSSYVVSICWIDPEGYLKFFHTIDNDSIKDGSVQNVHKEFTYCGHSFVCIKQSVEGSGSTDQPYPSHMSEVAAKDLVFVYRPLTPNCSHTLTLKSVNKTTSVVDVAVAVEQVNNSDGTVIDTSSKLYTSVDICGYGIRCEDGLFQEHCNLEQALHEDLSYCSRLLPPLACKQLQSNTHIIINKCITFGTKKRPIIGRACTYHSLHGSEWLRRHGMCISKAGCIEIYNITDYLDARADWGTGGGLLHEFTHAYHDKLVTGGFGSALVQEAYRCAMYKKLYASVPVHGSQGNAGSMKAYACSNKEEFFAETSVAYLYNEDLHGLCEYNKWFPFNRQQLQQYDPDTYQILELLWGV